jgi:hypothetical protein
MYNTLVLSGMSSCFSFVEIIPDPNITAGRLIAWRIGDVDLY